MKRKVTSKYIVIFFFAITLYLSYLVIKPFFIPLIAGFFIAYLFYPVYKLIHRKVRSRNLSAFIASFLLIILITLPLYFLISTVAKEATEFYSYGTEKIEAAKDLNEQCDPDNVICNSFATSSNYIRVVYYVEEVFTKFSSYLLDTSKTFILHVPRRLLDIFITLFITFYLFRDGSIITRRIKSLFSLKQSHERPIIKSFNDVTKALFYGNTLMALIEGFVGGLGFFIFGIPSPVLWGIVMGFLAFLPVIGPGIVWIIASVYLIFNGGVIPGTLLFLYGLFIITPIDMIVKPRVIGGKANVHPAIILVGLVGGIAVFGIIGFFLGPLILALLMTFIEIYEIEKIR